jgi:hypothetical protein
MEYQPDLVIWMTTLEAFPLDKQLTSPLVAHNQESLLRLASSSGLRVDPNDPAFSRGSFWGSTIIGRQRDLADVFRLQLYGVMWAATGIDQVYPSDYQKAQTDLEADQKFHEFEPPVLDINLLAFNALETGIKMAGDTPIIIVNEPMLISAGKNSDIRYNFFYPRWAYDQYRAMMSKNNWAYIDLWDVVPASEFTNSSIHLTPAGEAQLAEKLTPVITAACK